MKRFNLQGRAIAGLIAAIASLPCVMQTAQAAGYERKEVTFPCQGLKCAAWHYLPKGIAPGDKRPAIVMAHGFSAVKEMGLDGVAAKFADAGFVVLVFDYRYFGASEGEPRGRLLWHEQHQDYRDAITWVSLRPEVDPARLGVWGYSYSGGHVMSLAPYDRRIKAVVAQAPAVDAWDTYYAPMPAERLNGTLAWFAQQRTEQMASGKVAYIPVAAPVDQLSVWPLQEWYDGFKELAKDAPAWSNKITVESLETSMTYAPTAAVERISPTPFLMVIGSDDVITPTPIQKQAFDRAREPKKLVVVQGARHFDAYSGAKHEQFAAPAVEWFKQWLMATPSASKPAAPQ